jgi:hypothetical protein
MNFQFEQQIVFFSLSMSYTDEEEAWLNKQFGLFDSAFRSVPLGDKLMQDFVRNSFGASPSRFRYVLIPYILAYKSTHV